MGRVYGFVRKLSFTGFVLTLLYAGAPTSAQGPPARPQDLSAIEHFVFIIKENRTFDNYFGTYPGADGATTGVISTGEVIPLSHMPDVAPRDVRHIWASSHIAVDNGRMDRFDLIDQGLGKPCNVNGDYLCYSQLVEQDIPNYFSYARNFVLADQAFSSTSSASFPNHLYTVAAQSGGAADNPTGSGGVWGCDSPPGTVVSVLDDAGTLSKQFPCFDFQTLADRLEGAGLNWKYYAPGAGQSGYQWSALDAIDHVRNTGLWKQHVVPVSQFITDALQGNLPAVSWLTPDGFNSEHLPQSACGGENWTVKQVNAVMQGPQWNSTVIVLVWDDFGGVYDHVPPPADDQFGQGIRVPLLIISPYSRRGYISHTIYEFSSFVRLVEQRFNLAPLALRDSAANDMQDSFDFTQTPLAPLVLPPRQCPVASTAQLNFRPQRVNTSSPVQTVTLTNFGTSNLTISGVTISGDYRQSNACSVIKPNKTCSISVTFTPRGAGLRNGTLRVSDNDPSSPQSITLAGVGTNVILSPALLSFPATVIGQTSSAKSATLTNYSGTTLNISGIVPAGDYTQSNTCGSRVPAGGTCKLTVRFKPSVTGTRFGTVTVNDSDGGGPHVLKLTGSGSLLTISPTSLNFGSLKEGAVSKPLTVTLTNQGADAIAISQAVFQDKSFFNLLDYFQTNNCGASLNPGANCTFNVSFSPLQTGTRSGTLYIYNSEAATSPKAVSLSGTGLAAPLVSLAPSSLSFPDQQLGSTSNPQPIILTNTGSATLNISKIVASGDYSENHNCGAQVAIGGSCTINVTFTPTVAGPRGGAITITDDAANSPQTVPLSGNGAAPAVSLSPASLKFEDQLVGSASEPQPVTLTNAGSSSLTIDSIAATGDFTQTNDCGASPGPGAYCTISLTFAPVGLGVRDGSVTITDNANDSPQSVPLSGNGVAPAVSLSPGSLSFGDQLLGSASQPQPVTLTNSGTGLLTIISIAASGDFAQTNDCSNELAAGAQCTIQVTFTPTDLGARNANLTFTDSATDSPQSIPLSGNGVAPAVSLSTSSLTFPDQAVGTSSDPLPVTLTNTGTAPLNVSSISTTGDFAETNDCGNVVPAGGNCTISVTFTPSQAGQATGEISIVDDAVDSPQIVSLSGNGIEP